MLSNKVAVVVAGANGNLGKAVLEVLLSKENITVLPFTLGTKSKKVINWQTYSRPKYFFKRIEKELAKFQDLVLVDCTTLPNWKVINLLADKNIIIPTIILGTGESKSAKTDLAIARNKFNKNLRVVRCANSSTELVDLLFGLRQMLSKGSFEGSSVFITESHQSTKKTSPGYALKLKKIFEEYDLIVSEIKSIRDPLFQLGLGINEDHLYSHAAHWILIKKDSLELKIETKIIGMNSYANGSLSIISHMLKTPFFGILDWEDIS